MRQSGIILLGLCLSFASGAESEWLIPQPTALQTPSSVNTSQQDCNYTHQIAMARQGNAENQYQVALCYYYGLSIDADADKALHWLKQAASKNHSKAMYQLAEFYNRHDKHHNPVLAMEWYKKAAAKDHVKAQLRLAEMYAEGKGVSPDYVEAYKWFYLAGMFGANGEPSLRGNVRRQRQMLTQKMNRQQMTQAREVISDLLKQSPSLP